jgi:hypothetical protein
MTQNDAGIRYPSFLVWVSRAFSLLFHPLFTGIFMMLYITYLNPTIFLAVGEKAKFFKFLTFVNNNLVFPILIVLLMRGLGFSRSIQLETQKERIVPYIACITFFFWTYYVFRNQPDSPMILTDMCQGIFLASCIALVLNSFMKISMHAIGMGGAFGLLCVVLASGNSDGLLPFAVTILLTGIVCTSRLIASDHTPAEILTGLIVGTCTQLFTYWI